MEKKIRLGVIGCGGRGRGLMAEAIAPVKTMEIVAICDLIPERMDLTIEKLKETVKSDDYDAIKRDTEALEQAFYAISEKLYAQQQGAGGFDPNAQGANNGGDGQTYYNADYEDKTGN